MEITQKNEKLQKFKKSRKIQKYEKSRKSQKLTFDATGGARLCVYVR